MNFIIDNWYTLLGLLVTAIGVYFTVKDLKKRVDVLESKESNIYNKVIIAEKELETIDKNLQHIDNRIDNVQETQNKIFGKIDILNTGMTETQTIVKHIFKQVEK